MVAIMVAFSKRVITHSSIALVDAMRSGYRHLPAAALNHTCAFQLAGSVRDGWSLNTQHFGKKILGDRECVLVTVAISVGSSRLPAKGFDLQRYWRAGPAARRYARPGWGSWMIMR
jgi:hypothetical protein